MSVLETREFVERQCTFDLAIGDIHTCYVLAGDTPVLVHNAGGDPGPGSDISLARRHRY